MDTIDIELPRGVDEREVRVEAVYFESGGKQIGRSIIQEPEARPVEPVQPVEDFEDEIDEIDEIEDDENEPPPTAPLFR